MRRGTQRIAVFGLGIAIFLAILVVVAFGDTPARPAVGEARWATLGEATLHYHASGPASGDVVVFFPSFARSAADFNELVEALVRAGFRTLALQPRGVEGSTLPSGDPTYRLYAGDLAAMLDAEEIDEPVHVLGHAYGNRIARTFATEYPQRTRSVVLLAAGGAVPTPPDVSNAIGRAMLAATPASMRRDAVGFAFFAEGNEVSEDWLRGWYPRAGLAEQKAVGAMPYEAWGHAGRAPILVLQPESDKAAAEGGRMLKDAFPDRVELVVVPGAGHALLPERPTMVAREVRRFLSQH